MKKPNKSILPVLLLAFLVTACGGGGGTGNGSNQAISGGIGGTGVSQGTITGFGSVILNGVKFNTDSTSFTIDDNPGSQDDLSVGMQVTVRVDATGINATTIEFEPEVEGPIDAVDTPNNALTVLGRTVIVDDNTKIEDSAGTAIPFSSLATDDMLEVSGLVLFDDKVQATYIKKEDNGFVAGSTPLELRGMIVSVDTVAETLVIAGQTIDYSSGTLIFEGITKSELAAGTLLEVKGTRGVTGTNMIATRIQKEDGTLGAAENDEVEIEGPVTEFFTPSAFSVSGQSVSTSATTTFEGGAANDIALNVRLEVEGSITSGVLVASKVKFHGNRIKIHATVEDKETDPNQPNSVTLLGKKVIINSQTRLEDDSSANTTPFTFADINPTDRLEIRGYLSNGVITATRVERQDANSEIVVQAPVEALDNPDLTVLMKTVKTTEATLFTDETTEPTTVLNLAEFFSKVKVGTLIKLTGTLSGPDINATEVEIED